MSKYNPNFEAFVKLGEFLRLFCDATTNKATKEQQDVNWVTRFKDVAIAAHHHNGWFTEENVMHSFKQWGLVMTRENLSTWLAPYNLQENKVKTVALIMAGNIPLVGFHDFLAVLITGNKAAVKLASSDQLLLPLIAAYLIHCEHVILNTILVKSQILLEKTETP